MKPNKYRKLLRNAKISFTRHSVLRMKERYWINRNQAILEIIDDKAIINEINRWCIEVVSNDRIYILSWLYRVITVK